MSAFIGRLLILWAFAVPAIAQPISSAEVVETLVSASHGLTWASGPQVEELLARVKDNPTPYIPQLLAQVDVNQVLASEDMAAVLRAENAVLVLTQAGGDAGRAALAAKLQGFYAEADKQQDRLTPQAAAQAEKSELIQHRQRLNRLVRLENHMVDAFAKAGDARIQLLVLRRLEVKGAEDPRVQLEYLRMTGKGDAELKARLQRLLDRPE